MQESVLKEKVKTGSKSSTGDGVMKNRTRDGLERRMDRASSGIDGLRVAWVKGFKEVSK